MHPKHDITLSEMIGLLLVLFRVLVSMLQFCAYQAGWEWRHKLSEITCRWHSQHLEASTEEACLNSNWTRKTAVPNRPEQVSLHALDRDVGTTLNPKP